MRRGCKISFSRNCAICLIQCKYAEKLHNVQYVVVYQSVGEGQVYTLL